MIYADVAAPGDTKSKPAYRQHEKCLNCGCSYIDHVGWSCYESGDGLNFEDLPTTERYLTASMKDSITPAVKKAKPKPKEVITAAPAPVVPNKHVGPDLSKWQTWAKASLRPGDCPCGCPRDRCPYHG